MRLAVTQPPRGTEGEQEEEIREGEGRVRAAFKGLTNFLFLLTASLRLDSVPHGVSVEQ